MKKKFAMLLALIIALTFSTYGQDTMASDSAMQEVMTLHDEVMTLMPSTVRLIGQLESVLDSSSDKVAVQNAIDGLKDANGAMSDWMQGFGTRFTAEEMYKGAGLSTEKKQWLAEEKNKVLELNQLIEQSIAQANAVLGNK